VLTKKLERSALWKLVQNHIRDYIVSHKLRPGDALPPEGQIAENLGASRSSVREAVKGLESLGILEVRHGNGLFVRVLNFDAVLEVLSYNLMFEPSRLLDLLRVRRILESSIIPEVIHSIQPGQLAQCQQVLIEWETKLEEGLPYSEQDRLFHQLLYQVVGNKLLVDLAGVFWSAYRNAETCTIPAAREGKSILEHHRSVLRAIEARDVGQAQRLMADHFREGEERLELALKDASDAQE
jgi:DNA-binding FadR family transcriptional regulator